MKKLKLGIALTALMWIMLSFSSFGQQPVYGQTGRPVEASGARNGPALYDQYNPLGSGYISSQEFTDPAFTSSTNFSAEDFVVPAGETWNVNYVDVAGAYFEWTGNSIYALNIFFYSDNNGVPGDILNTFSAVSTYNEIILTPEPRICKYEITLPSEVELTAGHYWICVQAVCDQTNRWGWLSQTGPTIENEFQWKNPGDGFGLGYTDWTTGSLISWGDLNLAFALFGAGLDNDLSMVSIDAPSTAAALGSAEQITVSLKNEGTTTLTGFDVSYSVDGGTAVTENVGALSLTANQTGQYTFAATADFSTPGTHLISATALAAGDPRPENNTAVRQIYNLGTVYAMPSTGNQSITSCGASFTDAGGLDGNYGDYDNAVTTISPANAGDRIKLTFLEFNAGWGGFSIYNGPDTLSQLLGTWFGTESPGVINALNPTGTLTIHFMGSGWENTPGWVAYISCTTPVTDDFAVLNLKCSLPTIFVGDNSQLTAKIQNYGTLTQEKTVTFKANGVVIGTQMTGQLGVADTVLVSIPWTPDSDGDFVIEASVPTDLGTDVNDFVTIDKHVYPFGAFFEDFEGAMFPPENWKHGGLWGKTSVYAYTGIYSAQCFIGNTQSDTLITPRLLVQDGGILSFAARTTMWWVGNMDIFWLDESTGIRSFVQNVPLSIFNFGEFSIDMSAYTGIGRIAFFVNVTDINSFSGDVMLDNVLGTGITVYSDNNDLRAKTFAGSTFYNVNEPANFSLTLRNDGLLAVAAGDYTVKLMKGGDTPVVLQSVAGNDIASREEQTFELSYTFTEIDNLPVYAVIEYAADQYPVNNTSNSLNLNGLAAASEVVTVGEGTNVLNMPIDFTLRKSLCETIYLNSDINQTGVIFGISYNYNFKRDETDTPVRIWMGETSSSDLSVWVPATEMTLVYDGLLDFPGGVKSVYIKFHTPYNYSDGSKNLVIMTEKIGKTKCAEQYFYSEISLNATSIGLASDTEIPDPYAPEGGWPTNLNPNIRFVFNNNLGSAAGTVSGEGSAPVEGAKIVVNELNITTYTDAAGNYQLPYVPAGEFSATADKFTYLPLTQTLGISLGNATDLDFSLSLLDLLTVSGNITGNNAPATGIADADIILTGYSNYTSTSGANGDFSIGNVYSNNTYQLQILAYGYDAYNVEVVVVNSNIDLGNIVLTESLIIPYTVFAQPADTQAVVQWAAPAASAQQVLAFDDGSNEDGYAGEVGEEVWLGNYFPMDQMSTVTSFDIFWASYGTDNQQTMRLDIFDDQANLIVSSQEFMSGKDTWVNVDVPNMTLQGNFYAMIHWNTLAVQSTYLAFDTAQSTPDYAFYLYPGGSFMELSALTGKHGSFLLHANVLADGNTRDAGRTVNSYDLSFGLLSDIANAGNWPLLNTEHLTQTEFTDLNWPPDLSGKYVYSVKALYTNGESELSFSNALDFLFVGNSYLPAEEIVIYPNPATEYVNVYGCAGSDVLLFGMDGRLLFNCTINKDNYRLDVSSYAKGSYLLVVSNNTSFKQQKLIIE